MKPFVSMERPGARRTALKSRSAGPRAWFAALLFFGLIAVIGYFIYLLVR
jgi:hypothetical protein